MYRVGIEMSTSVKPLDLRRLLKEHEPIPQEGMPFVKTRIHPTGEHPIVCKCGEGYQTYWEDGFTYSAWLDHFQLQYMNEQDK